MIDELPEDIQRRMMEKLLGGDNLKRLEKTSSKGERFKYRRPVITAEYYCFPTETMFGESWCVNVIENGARRTFKEGLTEDQCMLVVRAISKKGIPVKKLETEWMKSNMSSLRPGRSESGRRAMIDQLRGFRP